MAQHRGARRLGSPGDDGVGDFLVVGPHRNPVQVYPSFRHLQSVKIGLFAFDQGIHEIMQSAHLLW